MVSILSTKYAREGKTLIASSQAENSEQPAHQSACFHSVEGSSLLYPASANCLSKPKMSEVAYSSATAITRQSVKLTDGGSASNFFSAWDTLVCVVKTRNGGDNSDTAASAVV